ncbi:MAG: regulatory protein RecX [Lachnospiraceae bacterium]|nr:regulatory protein RecX [Lachnospiraceae bacterium]
MTVTNVTEVSKARSKVYIDEEFAFVLYKGELRLYHVKLGEELKQEDYDEIMQKVLPKRAKLRSLNLLKDREYTEKQLRDKLRQGFYPDEIIQEAVDYVKSYRYIDDRRYAQQYITYQLSYRSRKRIEQDLMKKGIQKDIIKEFFEQIESDEMKENEIQLIKKLVEKRHFDWETATSQEKMKLYGFLYRKGFTSENIKKVIQTAEFYD